MQKTNREWYSSDLTSWHLPNKASHPHSPESDHLATPDCCSQSLFESFRPMWLAQFLHGFPNLSNTCICVKWEKT